MDATTVTVIGVLGSALVTGLAAMYASRIAGRSQREGNAVTGFNSLTDQLQEERKELRADVAALRLELATSRAEEMRLKLLVQQLGGTP
jgi:hypothetical protein